MTAHDDDDPYNIRGMFSEKPDAPPMAAPQAPIGIIPPRPTGATVTIPYLIRALCKSRSWQQKDLARALSISEGYVSDILTNRRALSTYVALRLEQTFGIEHFDAETVLIKQVRSELAQARREFAQ